MLVLNWQKIQPNLKNRATISNQNGGAATLNAIYTEYRIVIVSRPSSSRSPHIRVSVRSASLNSFSNRSYRQAMAASTIPGNTRNSWNTTYEWLIIKRWFPDFQMLLGRDDRRGATTLNPAVLRPLSTLRTPWLVRHDHVANASAYTS